MTPTSHARVYRGFNLGGGRDLGVIIDPPTFVSSALAGQLADLWLAYCQLGNVSIGTATGYSSAIKRFLRFCGRRSNGQPIVLASPALRDALVEFEDSILQGSVRIDTAGKYLRRLRTILRYAVQRNAVVSHPVQHWAFTPCPVSEADWEYNLPEYSRQEGRALRRAAREDVGAALARLQRFQGLAESAPDVHRWVLNCLATAPTQYQLVRDLQREKGFVASLEAVHGSPLGLRALDVSRAVCLTATLSRREMLAFYILLAWGTGREPEALRALTIEDVRLDADAATVRLTKTRARKRDTIEIRAALGSGRTYVTLRDLIACTAHAREATGRPSLWQGAVIRSNRVAIAQMSHENYGIVQFDQDHALGLSKPHDSRRIRKSHKAVRAAQGGSLWGAISGDHTERTYRKHYQQTPSTMAAAGRTIRDAQERVTLAATTVNVVVNPARTVAADSAADDDIRELARSTASESTAEQSLRVSACTDPYQGPHTRPGDLCLLRPVACIGCTNSVVFADHLPQLLLMQQHINQLRETTDPNMFVNVWGPRLDWIDAVVDRFPSEAVNSARSTSSALHIPLAQRLCDRG